MDIVSEIIAIDDAANKLEEDARLEAAAIEDGIKADELKRKERNEQELLRLRQEYQVDTDKEIELAKKQADSYEENKRAELDELFRNNRQALVREIAGKIIG